MIKRKSGVFSETPLYWHENSHGWLVGNHIQTSLFAKSLFLSFRYIFLFLTWFVSNWHWSAVIKFRVSKAWSHKMLLSEKWYYDCICEVNYSEQPSDIVYFLFTWIAQHTPCSGAAGYIECSYPLGCVCSQHKMTCHMINDVTTILGRYRKSKK